MSVRASTCRFAFLTCVIAGLACANLIGIEGLWWKTGASDAEIWTKYREDAKGYNSQSEDLRKKGTLFFDYTELRQSRVHGWPFRCLWCDVMSPGWLGMAVRATPWMFDGAKVFELRLWPLLADIAVVVGIAFSTYWTCKRYQWRIQRQFTLVSLLGAVLATALTLWTWLPRERFATEMAPELLHSYGAAKEWLACLGWYLAIGATFIALSCGVTITWHVVEATSARRNRTEGPVVS